MPTSRVRFVSESGEVAMRMICLVCLALAAPVAVRAADPTPVSTAPAAAALVTPPLPEGLLPLLDRPAHRVALLQAAQAVEKSQPGACQTGTYATTGEIAILLPLKFDSQGRAVSGAWKESMNETGCSIGRVLNALTTVGPNDTLETQALLPGTTITDPELQLDSVQYAAAAMGDLPPGCDEGGIIDTAFVGMDGEPPGTKPKPGSVARPWTENWTLQACAKRAVIVMHFKPDATGTTIEATPYKGP
jgi:hypothetical protein